MSRITPNGLIVVAGSANMDLVVRAPRLPAPGETLLGSHFETIHGGKGANQAVAAARLGARVAMLACVGMDAFGTRLREAMQNDGIDVTHVHGIVGQPSGIAVITVGDDSANSIVVAPGANSALSAAHIDAASDVIAHAGMLICQLEVPESTVIHAIERAARHGTPVLFNPAPAPTHALPDTLYAQIHYLLVNETEAGLMTGVTVSDAASARAASAALRAKGVRNVMVTLGAAGVVWEGEEGNGHAMPPPVVAVDTTAAGDTFAGGFAAARVAGAGMHEAIDFAQRAAAVSVTRVGAQTSIPRLVDVPGPHPGQIGT